MKTRFFIAMVLATALAALTGCETMRDFNKERYERNNETARAWLSDQIFPAEIDVSGTWKSAGWGESFFAQTGRDVRGHLGDYPVEGVVSGKKVYLLANKNGWHDYSVILETPAPNILLGYSSRAIPYQTGSRKDLRLDRK